MCIWMMVQSENQKRSPRIFLAKTISLCIIVTLLAWWEHMFASSNKETIAASVASWSATNALAWNLNWVSRFKLLTIVRTNLMKMFTFSLEGCSLHEKIGCFLISFDLSHSFCARSPSSLLDSCFNWSRFPCDFLWCEFLLGFHFIISFFSNSFGAGHLSLINIIRFRKSLNKNNKYEIDTSNTIA